MLKKILAYIYFFPLSLFLAIIVSGIFSIIQNTVLYFYCNFSLLRVLSFPVDCSGDFSKRTFLADVIFYGLLIYFVEKFIPEHKKKASIIVALLLAVFFLVLIVLSVMTKNFSEDLLNSLIILGGLIIYLIIRIRKKED